MFVRHAATPSHTRLWYSSRMKRPTYEIEHFKENYDYHRDFQPNKAFARSAYRLIHRVMQPEVAYEPESQQTLADLGEARAPQIYALNHLSNLHDQWTAAAIAQEIAPEMVGDIRVLAKDGFYNGELLAQLGVSAKYHRVLQPLMTRFVNNMGTIPVSRTKNHTENRALSLRSNQYMMDMLGDLLEEGHPIAAYFESTHNYVHPEKNLPLKSGIGHLAKRTLAPDKTPASIVPIGVSYGRDYTPVAVGEAKPKHIRRAQVYIGKIATVEHGMSINDITQLAAVNLQNATTRAFELYDQRAQ